MKEPIIIPKKGAVNLLYLAGALVFTGLCLVFSFSSFSYLPSGHQTLMAVLKPILFFGIFFFGLCSYYYAKRIFQDRPLLLVDETGVTDHSTAFAVGTSPGKILLPFNLPPISTRPSYPLRSRMKKPICLRWISYKGAPTRPICAWASPSSISASIPVPSHPQRFLQKLKLDLGISTKLTKSKAELIPPQRTTLSNYPKNT